MCQHTGHTHTHTLGTTVPANSQKKNIGEQKTTCSGNKNNEKVHFYTYVMAWNTIITTIK